MPFIVLQSFLSMFLFVYYVLTLLVCITLKILVMNKIVSTDGSLILNGSSSISRDCFSVSSSGNQVVVRSTCGKSSRWAFDYDDCEIDGEVFDSTEALVIAFASLSSSGSGEGCGGSVSWDSISDKPAVIASGEDEESARASIGAGTSNLVIGTSATQAKAGNYAPTWAQVTGKPAVIGAGADAAAARTAIGAGVSNLAIGTAATDAKAGNYQPTWAQVSSKPAVVVALPSSLGTAGQVLAVNAAGTGLEWVDPA